MGSLVDLGVNLVAALIGFLVARSVSRLRYLRRTRSTRRLWRSLGAGKRIDVVIPVFNDPQTAEFEASGLLGRGDLACLLDLQRTLLDIGASYDVVEDRLFKPTSSRGQVLIGSPDSNMWTEHVLKKLNTQVGFGTGDDWNVVEDRSTGVRYPASAELVGRGLADDVGIIVSAESPLSPGRVLVLAGAFGYGSQAAARLVTDSIGTLLACGLELSEPFELIFTVSVVNKDVLEPRVEVARNIGEASA